MATQNTNEPEIEELSTNQNSFLLSAPRRIFQDFSDVHINPLDSFSVDAESPSFRIDSSAETPNKYPNAPQSSPIDIQNNRDISTFNKELIKCLNKLPVILPPSKENEENCFPEIAVFESEDHIESYMEPSNSTEPEMESDTCKVFEDQYDNFEGSCSITTRYITWNKSDDLDKDGKNGSTGHFPANTSNQTDKPNLLRVQDFNRDFHKSAFSDNESIIANCASDVSDISIEELEFTSSSRDRIELEALALDSAIHPCIFQRLQHWKTLSRKKRALSLDEMNPLKILHTNEFYATEFELTV